jgi:hypothetical protein
MKEMKLLYWLDRLAKIIEIIIAFILLIIISIKIFEVVMAVSGINFSILSNDFESVLSSILTLVIGIEFTKMLCKQTPDAVIDVLLFAAARQIVTSHGASWDMLIGVLAIAGLFAAKKYLVSRIYFTNTDL